MTSFSLPPYCSTNECYAKQMSNIGFVGSFACLTGVEFS